MSYRFGIIRIGSRPQSRKLFMRNTSVLPIAINWHAFLMKPTTATKTIPFNVVIDAITPFTNNLRSNLRSKKEKTDIEELLKAKFERYTPERSTEVLDKFNPVSVTNSDTSESKNFTRTETESSTYLSSSFITTSQTSSHEESSSEFSAISRRGNEYSKDNAFAKTIDQRKSEETRNTEFKISILPYYGLVDTKSCIVSPREIFVSPKENASVTITINPKKCRNIENEGKFLCKILGFLRIAPMDKYRDNCYAREDGDFFPPIEINVEAQIIKPQLAFDFSKPDRTFTICASEVMRSRNKKLKTRKTFFFYNPEDDTIYISLETHDPFSIKSVSIYAEANPCKPLEKICINGHGCAEVEISCTVDRDLIETMMNAGKCQDLQTSTVTLKELLVVAHTDKSIQEVELILRILLPSLNLSSYTLNFGLVYIGDTKKQVLVVENLSACKHDFTINKKFNNSDFDIDRGKRKVLDHFATGRCSTITISFTPKISGQSVETLEITPDIPNSMEECMLYGEGTLDEKYHTPGV